MDMPDVRRGVPAKNSCGVCGGGVRLYRGALHGRPITDWKHTWVPEGTSPHRPVLGRPVDVATLERLRPDREVVVDVSEEPAVPLVAPRAAHPAEVPPSAMRVYVLGGEYGWSAPDSARGALVYYQTAVGDEVCVLRLRRADLGAVGVWERRAGRDWRFAQAFTRCRSLTEQVGSEQLKAWLRQPDERCPDCGASSASHREGECP